jgi:anti-sigma regulatory factor (Ser/Thr protein kinase)
VQSTQGKSEVEFEIDEFPATLEGFERAIGELRKSLAGTTLPRGVRYNVEVVFEEAVTNVVRHGGRPPDVPRVAFSMNIGADGVALVFTDDGVAFNPCEHPEPEFFQSLASAKLGGLGILLIRKASAGMTYQRTPQNQNRLTVTVATHP